MARTIAIGVAVAVLFLAGCGGGKNIAAREKDAVAAIDDALAAFDKRSDSAAPLATALELLESAEGELASSR